MGLWEKFKSGLKKTSDKLEVALRFSKLDDDALQELEDALILTDMGAGLSTELIASMAKQKPQTDIEAKQILASKLKEVLSCCSKPLQIQPDNGPFVILMVGVNGTGKTTTIGKLASQYQTHG